MTKFSSESINKILVPIDGSNYSISAAEYAMGIAKFRNAEVLIVFVVDEVVIDQFAKVNDRKAVEAELKKDGERYTNYALRLAEKENVKITQLIVRGRPYEQIVNLAKSFDVDLIVMGTYGHRGAERILIGSVTERVIEYSPCPVLVIK